MDNKEQIIKDLKGEIKDLKGEINDLNDLNSDMLDTLKRLKNCLNCNYKKWCKETPDDYSGCDAWEWE